MAEITTSLIATSRSRSWSRARQTTPMAPRPIGCCRLYRPAMTRPVIEGIAGPYQRLGMTADRQQRARGLGEEIVALVVDDDESGEVPDLDLPHRLHAKFRVFQHFNPGNAVLREPGGSAADRAEVEAAVALARLGYGSGPVALRQHNQRATGCLESFHIRIHASGGRRPEGPRRVPFRGLRGARV